MNVTLKSIDVGFCGRENGKIIWTDYNSADITDMGRNVYDLIDDALDGFKSKAKSEYELTGNTNFHYIVDGNEWTVDFEEDTKEFNVYSDDLGLDVEGYMYPDFDKPLSEVIKDHTGYIEKVISWEWKND